jgi:hypothetical protein
MPENKLPDTIKHPGSFIKSQWYIECSYCGEIIGFDGVFPWGWIIEAVKSVNPKSKIMPMDFDAVIERNSHYLVIETKDIGVDIEMGQLITLNNLKHPKSFTVMKIWGKENPVKMEINKQDGQIIIINNFEEMKNWVRRWYKMADKNK